MRCAKASIGRCFLIEGDGTGVRQSRERETDESPLGRCRDKSWALKANREGKDAGSLAEAGSLVGGVLVTLRAAKRHLYLP